MKARVLDIKGKSVRKVLNRCDLRDRAKRSRIYLDVKQYLRNQRQGTHKLQRLRFLVVLVRLKSKKEQVQHVLVLSRIHCSAVEVILSVLSQEITPST